MSGQTKEEELEEGHRGVDLAIRRQEHPVPMSLLPPALKIIGDNVSLTFWQKGLWPLSRNPSKLSEQPPCVGTSETTGSSGQRGTGPPTEPGFSQGFFSPFCQQGSFSSLPLSPLACLVGDTSFTAISPTLLHRYYLN